jgi:hypothetical protein
MFEAACRDRKGDAKRNYLGMSILGDPCDRKLWLSFRGFPVNPFDGRVLMIFEFGNLIEAQVIKCLRLAGYEIDDQQQAFTGHNGFLGGHCDGRIKGVTQREHILEVKSANVKKFKAFQQYGVEDANYVYYAQCQMYMGYSGLERALLVVQCKDNCDIYTERIRFMREDFETLNNRAKDIITANTAPPVVFDADSLQCTYCNCRNWCFNLDGAVNDTMRCGTCRYLVWDGGNIQPWCYHSDHRFPLKQWGVGCPDWKPYEF